MNFFVCGHFLLPVLNNPLYFPNSFKVLSQFSENTGLSENKVSCCSHLWKNLILTCPTEKLNRLGRQSWLGWEEQHPLLLTVLKTALGPWK